MSAVNWNQGPTTDFIERVAFGLEPKWNLITQVATQPALSSSFQSLWPLSGTIVWPTAAGQVSIVSSDAGDTAAGLGAQAVLIRGLDANLDPISEVVPLSGTSPALSVQEFFRCNDAAVAAEGASGAANLGNITGSIGGNPQFYIVGPDGAAPGSGVSSGYFYTVPRGRTAVIYNSTWFWGEAQNLEIDCIVVPAATGIELRVLRTSFNESSSGATVNPRVVLNEGDYTWCDTRRLSGNGGRLGFISQFLEYNPNG